MSPTRTVTLTDELYDQASREAAAEGKTTDEITRDALTAYWLYRAGSIVFRSTASSELTSSA